VLVFAALAMVVDGLANQVIALAVPSLMKAWRLPHSGFANVLAAGLFGVLAGNLLGGVLGDRFGRRKALIGSILLFGFATAAMGLANDRLGLTVARALGGLGVGGAIPNATAMIAEFTPARRRSIAIAMSMMFIAVGGVVSGLLAAWLLPWVGWRGLFFWGGALPIAIAILFVAVLPESPRFLHRAPHRKTELVKLLGRFGLEFGSDDEFHCGAQDAEGAPLTALFGPKARGDTALLWVAFFFGLLASYTLFSWAPVTLSGFGFGERMTSWTMSAFSVGGMVGGLSCGLLFDRIGSRLTMTLAMGGVAVALALAVVHIDAKGAVWATAGLMAAEGFFIGAISNAVYTLAANAYPPSMRATGVGAAAAVGRLGATISSYTGGIALDRGGAPGYFVTVALTVGLSNLAMILMRKQIPQNRERVAAVGGGADAIAP
jgi:AAHS family 4-hydroxybenzoate transporter-like MFS transporter